MRVLSLLLALTALASAALPLAPAATDVYAARYSIPVDGETALGWVAYPTSSTPTTLLVYGHGCCGKPNQSAFVEGYARAYGVAAVAMDYRGPGGWDVMKGHRDLIAATEDLQARFPIERTVIWGVSMGGETTGMAVAARPDLYDYWVDTFGVTNLFEEFVTLGHYPGVGLNPNDPSNPTSSAIIRETGGTPATAPDAYLARSPALMTDHMVGIQRAYVLHGIGDLIVPYSMSRETFDGLVANGVPASMYTFTTRPGNVQGPWGVPTGACAPAPAPPGTCAYAPATPAGLAAHDGSGGWSLSYTLVDQLLRGYEPDAGYPVREHVADYTLSRFASGPP